MANELCGPSNALQNFQKHSTVDRTLQQDRLISRPFPSQGFRSSTGPPAGHLDHEFEAFQAGHSLLDQGFQSPGFQFAPQSLQQQPGASGWASDFQRLNISSPPQFHQQPFSPLAQQRQDTGGWHQDFARQQGQVAGNMTGQIPIQAHSSYQYSPMNGLAMVPQLSGGFVGPQAEISSAQQQQQSAEVFDEEAFARAFDEAANAERDAQQELEQQKEMELDQNVLIDESAERFMEEQTLMAKSEALLEQKRIGADTIHDPLSVDSTARENQDDPEALARTAAQLLDSVRNDQSSKFQNSQFLLLMRQFRDKEVTVAGDKIVERGGETSMGGDREAIQVAFS